MKKTIRIIRTYEVNVEAEYGDTPESLIEKGQAAVTDKTKYVESAVMLIDEEHGGKFGGKPKPEEKK